MEFKRYGLEVAIGTRVDRTNCRQQYRNKTYQVFVPHAEQPDGYMYIGMHEMNPSDVAFDVEVRGFILYRQDPKTYPFSY